MAKQETLTIFQEIENVTRKLSDLQLGILMRAIMAYRWHGESYEGEDIAVDIAFQFLSNQVDRCEEAKAAKSRVAKEARLRKLASMAEENAVDEKAEAPQEREHQMTPSMTNGDQQTPKVTNADQSTPPIHSLPVQSNPVHSVPVLSDPILSVPFPGDDDDDENNPFTRKSFPLTPSGLIRISVREYGDLGVEIGDEALFRYAAELEEEAQRLEGTGETRDWAQEIRRLARDKPKRRRF